MTTKTRLTAEITGKVQGVGFRWFVKSRADELSLNGWVENQSDGKVRLEAEGTKPALTIFIENIKGAKSPANVSQIDIHWDRSDGELSNGFLIKS